MIARSRRHRGVSGFHRRVQTLLRVKTHQTMIDPDVLPRVAPAPQQLPERSRRKTLCVHARANPALMDVVLLCVAVTIFLVITGQPYGVAGFACWTILSSRVLLGGRVGYSMIGLYFLGIFLIVLDLLR